MDTERTIVVATNNEGKLKEIKSVLGNEFKILSLKDANCEIEVEEDGDTFEENALKKAREVYERVKMPCLADDTGLCIDYFDGWPGIRTARFLGEKVSKEERNDYILSKMKETKEEERKAKVITSLALVIDRKQEIVSEGQLEGYIAREKKGQNGFGFDEIFELETGNTLAELSLEEKNKLSSRKKALENLKEKISNLYNNEK